jgi:hypothetical protein
MSSLAATCQCIAVVLITATCNVRPQVDRVEAMLNGETPPSLPGGEGQLGSLATLHINQNRRAA